MIEPDELRWLKTTANELNNLLQVIAETSKLLETRCLRDAETLRYTAMLQSGVDRATRAAQVMVDRIGGYRVEAPKSAFPLQQPVAVPVNEDVQIYNPQGHKELIMIVDDEELVTILAQRVLAEAGYRVVVARDGFQAIRNYRLLMNRISLIILDFTMPVMDGSDVFNELREMNPKVPVVLSSGFAEQERLRAMLAKGLRGFIPKPYTQQKLLQQIRSTLDAIAAESSPVPVRRVL